MVEIVEQKGVAIIKVDNPPMNVLVRDVRADIIAALNQLEDDQSIKAIVLAGAERSFPAGASFREQDAPEQAPILGELCTRVENCTKPVIAAIHGAALGPGFALALACHFRVAHKDARLGLPDVTMGLIPGGGTTQRLPRMLGASRALEMMLSGQSFRVDHATLKGVIDGVVNGDVVSAAHSVALKLLAEGTGPRQTRALRKGFDEPLAYQSRIAETEKSLAGSKERAHHDILRCVEAAQLLPFESGVAFEADLAEACRASEQSDALRHIFRAERDIWAYPERRSGTSANVASFGVVGGGGIAISLTLLALDHGLKAVLHAQNDEMAAQMRGQVDAIYASAVARGTLEESARSERLGRLTVSPALDQVCRCDLVFETTGADTEARTGLVSRMLAQMGPDARLVMVGDARQIDEVAHRSGAADRVVGAAFRQPAHVFRYCEVIPGQASSPDTVMTVAQCLRRLGRMAVRVSAKGAQGPAMMGDALNDCLLNVGLDLADQGVHPYSIDAALSEAGFTQPVFQSIDRMGLAQVAVRRAAGGWPGSRVLDTMLALERSGTRAGKGFLLYDDKSEARPDDGLTAVLNDLRDPAELPDSAIVGMAVAAIANGGAEMLGQGRVKRASDLDVAMVAGYGFPRRRGGPMKAADLMGLFQVQRTLEAFSETSGDKWKPAQYLKDLVKNGNKFSDRR